MIDEMESNFTSGYVGLLKEIHVIAPEAKVSLTNQNKYNAQVIRDKIKRSIWNVAHCKRVVAVKSSLH